MAEVKTGIEGDLYLYNGSINWSGTTTITGTRMGFCEGVSWSFDETNTQIWDRGTFSHWKKGRKGPGEVTIPQAYVDNLDVVAALAATISGSTAPRVQGELRQYGTAGALEHTVQFSELALKHYEQNEPEGDEKVTWSIGFDLPKAPVRSTSSRIA